MAMNNDAQEFANYVLFEANRFHPINHNIAEESRACIFLNGQELATLMCSPHDLDDLAIGFLRSEELISSIDDIASLTLSKQGTCVDVWLTHPLKAAPVRRITTSGCGGGVTFDDLLKERNPLTLSTIITTGQVGPLMKKLYQSANLYQDTRGIHTAALCDPEELLVIAEDIGRHNTIDRVWGRALKQGIDTQNKILISTGRISSEMLGKAAKAGIPIVISRTSPTSLSVKLARAWNITIIGYARGDSFRIYAAQDRVLLAEPINQQLPFNLPVI
jgi:FdhD protein